MENIVLRLHLCYGSRWTTLTHRELLHPMSRLSGHHFLPHNIQKLICFLEQWQLAAWIVSVTVEERDAQDTLLWPLERLMVCDA